MPNLSPEDNAFIELALDKNFITDKQLQDALDMMDVLPDKDISGVLVRLGELSEEKVNTILKLQRDRQKEKEEEERKQKEEELLRRYSETLSFTQLDEYLIYARKNLASDFHLCTLAPPFFRKYKKLQCLSDVPLSFRQAQKLIFDILSEKQKKILAEKNSLEFCYEIPGQGRYRACLLKQKNGWDASFRVIPNEIVSFEELNLSDAFRSLTEHHQGLILLTGPTGCGKTTTQAALIDLINRTRAEHVITLEQPIEYIHISKKCQITQREIGEQTTSYARALRAALRQDPDIIMIGELRDIETTSLAITAAETGHLVFGTLPTTSAISTIDRILDVFPPAQQPQILMMISESLRGIVSQQLIPKQNDVGVALAVEVLLNIPAVANLIRSRRNYQIPSTIEINKRIGMKLMDESLYELANAKIISGIDAYELALSKSKFEAFIAEEG